MEIDKCYHSFKDLAGSILPSYFDQIKEQIKKPLRMEGFAKPGIGEKMLLKNQEF